MLCTGTASGAMSQFLQSTLNAPVSCVGTLGCHTSLKRVFGCAGPFAAAEGIGWCVQQRRDAECPARGPISRGYPVTLVMLAW